MGLHPYSSAIDERDPVYELFAIPNTAFEFNTSSLTGLTALTPTSDVEDANTTIPGHYFLADDATGTSWCGRYVAPPSPPYTVITKMFGTPTADFSGMALFVGVTTPGAFTILGYNGNPVLIVQRFTSPTAFSSTVLQASRDYYPSPIWLAARVNSNTDVDWIFSRDGWIWRKFIDSDNPGITIGSVGIAHNSQNPSGRSAAAFDYLRIWNSALTMPGITA